MRHRYLVRGSAEMDKSLARNRTLEARRAGFASTVLATSRYESRLCVGLMEYVLQKAAGIRTEPPFASSHQSALLGEYDPQ